MILTLLFSPSVPLQPSDALRCRTETTTTLQDLAAAGPSEEDYAAVLEQSRRKLEEFAHDNRCAFSAARARVCACLYLCASAGIMRAHHADSSSDEDVSEDSPSVVSARRARFVHCFHGNAAQPTRCLPHSSRLAAGSRCCDLTGAIGRMEGVLMGAPA